MNGGSQRRAAMGWRRETGPGEWPWAGRAWMDTFGLKADDDTFALFGKKKITPKGAPTPHTTPDKIRPVPELLDPRAAVTVFPVAQQGSLHRKLGAICNRRPEKWLVLAAGLAPCAPQFPLRKACGIIL